MAENWFKRRREELKLSQSKVVQEFFKLGTEITIGAVSGWERGQVPHIDYVDAIASVYRTNTPKVLSVMHRMAVARKCKEPVAAK
jgi:transcriptional regulator with XRE-family HTH domain